MPSFASASLNVRLGVMPLQDAITPKVIIKKGNLAAQLSETTEKKLREGQFLEEVRVQFPGDKENMAVNFLAGRPFLQVQVKEQLQSGEELWKAQEGVHMLQGSSKETAEGANETIEAAPETSIGARSSAPSTRPNPQPPSRAVDPELPGISQASGPHRHSPASDDTELSPKALMLHVILTDKSFVKGFENNKLQNLRIDVFFNGMLSSSALISLRDATARVKSFHQVFAGYRVDYMVERPWVILPPGQNADGSLREPNEAVSAEERWHQICNALMVEANERGKNEHEDRPPTGEFLEALANMQMPDAVESMQKARGRRFGVIDVLITTGQGRKVNDGTGYLKSPQRLIDDRYLPKIGGEGEGIPATQEALAASEDTPLGDLIDADTPSRGFYQKLTYNSDTATSREVMEGAAEQKHSNRVFTSRNTEGDMGSVEVDVLAPVSTLSMQPESTPAGLPIMPPSIYPYSQNSAQGASTQQPQHIQPPHAVPFGPIPGPVPTLGASRWDLYPEIPPFIPWGTNYDRSNAATSRPGPAFYPGPPSTAYPVQNVNRPVSGHTGQSPVNSTFSDPVLGQRNMTSSPDFSQFSSRSSMSSPMVPVPPGHSGGSGPNMTQRTMQPMMTPNTPYFTSPYQSSQSFPTDQRRLTRGEEGMNAFYQGLQSHQALPSLYTLPPNPDINSMARTAQPHMGSRAQPFTPGHPFYNLSGPQPLKPQTGPPPPIGMFSATTKPKYRHKELGLIGRNRPRPSILIDRLIITGKDNQIVVDHRWTVHQRITVQAQVNEEQNLFTRNREEATGSATNIAPGSVSAHMGSTVTRPTTSSSTLPRSVLATNPIKMAKSVENPMVEHSGDSASLTGTSFESRLQETENPGIYGPRAAPFIFYDPGETFRGKPTSKSKSISPQKLDPRLFAATPKAMRPSEMMIMSNATRMVAPDTISSSSLSSVPPSPDSSSSGSSTSKYAAESFAEPTLMPSLRSDPSIGAMGAPTADSSTLQPSSSSRGVVDPSWWAFDERSSQLATKRRNNLDYAGPVKAPREPDRLSTTDNPSLNHDCVIAFAVDGRDKDKTGVGVLRQVRSERQGVFTEDAVICGMRFFVAG